MATPIVPKQRLFAITRDDDGVIRKRLVRNPRSTYKIHDKWVKDIESGLYIHKKLGKPLNKVLTNHQGK